MLRTIAGAKGTAALTGLIALGSATAANAQLTTSPPAADLPEIVVEGQQKSKSKAPAAAQHSSTPRASQSAPAPKADPVRAPDTSDVAVSPTGITTPVDQIASSVTVITSKEIEARQQRTLPEVLRSVPGVNVVQAGGPGGQTSIFMRGTNSDHTKVLIDGIDVSDPSASNRQFDLGQMLTNDIDRVEVLRGPQSGLYGADALGGAIVIYTKKGKGPLKATAMTEGGSFGTFNQAVAASGSSGAFNYSFNVSHYRADEVPVTPSYLLAPGTRKFDNSYDNWSYSTKLGVDINRDLEVNVVARYIDSELKFTSDDPNSFPAAPNNFQSRQDYGQLFTRGEVVWRSLGDRLTNTFGVNYGEQKRDFAPDNSFFDGERTKFDWRGVLKLAPGYTMVGGLSHEEEEMRNQNTSATEWNQAGFVELQTEPIRNFFLVANTRYDDNENFGGHETWRIAPAYIFEQTGTKIKGSVGTGFKAPTLDQRFSDYPDFLFFGNPDLKPEESTGYDAGFEQEVFGGRARFGATYFYNDITDLIQSTFDPSTFESTLVNIGKASTEGVEVFASLDATDSLRFRVDYTYTEARNQDTDKWLRRRPRHMAAFTAGWNATDALLLTGSVLYYGVSLDVDRATFGDVELPDYALVNVAADYRLNDNMSLFGRIDNVFDKQYESPNGFEGTGIGAFAGVRFNN